MVTWILAGFVPLFVVTWFLSLQLLAAMSGWRELARVYPAPESMEVSAEWRFRGCSMRYGSRYNGCLTIATNAMGIRLTLWPIFRPAHPPLFIPWTEIAATEPVHAMFYEAMRFSFARASTTLLLRRPLADEVLRSRPR